MLLFYKCMLCFHVAYEPCECSASSGQKRAMDAVVLEALVPYKSEECLAHWATSPAPVVQCFETGLPLYLRLARNWLCSTAGLGYTVILLSQPSRAVVTGMYHHSGLGQAVDEIDLCLVHASVNCNCVSPLFSLQFIRWSHRHVLGTRSAMPFLENTMGVKGLRCLVLHVIKSSHEESPA